MKLGKVSLVGAGPGDPELLTLRAYRLLQEADVILYDRLVSDAILALAGVSTQLLYVGKEPEESSLQRQQRIHRMLVDWARKGKRVVRLKGGDPFVFGRGGEEALALRQAGIPFEVVPGISSAIAVPSAAGIPVTHRGLASSFGVFAGREADHGPSTEIDWEAAARVHTAVFLMGVQRLPHIIEQLRLRGRSMETPVAVIERGTLPEQRVVAGVLTDIVARVREVGISSPAVIVVGEVVSMHETLMPWLQTEVWEGSALTTVWAQAG